MTTKMLHQSWASERDKHDQIARWLGSKLSNQHLRVQKAEIFGSIVHDHYATSDVDVIIMFKQTSNRQIGRLVRQIKGSLADDFSSTFAHLLHVTFFCAHEEAAMQDFMRKAGKHETLDIRE